MRWPALSDFDVVIKDDSLRHHPTYSVLSALKTAVVKCQFAQHHEVRLITGAKVPIVKLKTSNQFGRFDMDVSFNSDKGPEGARESLRLLKEVEMRRPGNAERVKRLALLLKALLVTCELNEVRDGGIGGLTVFCMALSHVQVREHTSTPLARNERPLTLPIPCSWTTPRPARILVMKRRSICFGSCTDTRTALTTYSRRSRRPAAADCCTKRHGSPIRDRKGYLSCTLSSPVRSKCTPAASRVSPTHT